MLALSPWSRADDNGDGATGVIETRSAAAEDTTQPATGTGSPPADPSASATEPQTAEAATEAAASESEDDGGPEGGGSGTDPTEDEGGQVEPGAASLPDVTGIWYTDARDELASAGWESVVLDTVADDPGNGQTECSVVHQNPSGGTPTHYDTTVTLTYWESFPGAC
nr:hypothetical protein GCM10025732_02800 [Glycomyces mayteni]